MIVLTAVTNVT